MMLMMTMKLLTGENVSLSLVYVGIVFTSFNIFKKLFMFTTPVNLREDLYNHFDQFDIENSANWASFAHMRR